MTTLELLKRMVSSAMRCDSYNRNLLTVDLLNRALNASDTDKLADTPLLFRQDTAEAASQASRAFTLVPSSALYLYTLYMLYTLYPSKAEKPR